MEYPLSITTVVETIPTGQEEEQSQTTYVMAEAELHSPTLDFPPSYLASFSMYRRSRFSNSKKPPGWRVLFRGPDYRFEALEPTGTFKIVRGA